MNWMNKYKGFLAFGLFFIATIIQILADKIYSKNLEPLSTNAFLVAAAVWTIQGLEKEQNSTTFKKYGVIIITVIFVSITTYFYVV